MPRAPAGSPAVGPAHFHAAPQAPLMPASPRHPGCPKGTPNPHHPRRHPEL